MSERYFTQLSSSFNAKKLAEFLAERITSHMRVVIVSEEPEKVFPKLADAWRAQYGGLIAERDHEQDIVYMGALTKIITAMQRSSIAYSELSGEQEFLLAHPYEIEGSMWQGRRILVCTDELSTQACANLLRDVKSDFRLIVFCSKISSDVQKKLREAQVSTLFEAEKELRSLLKKQAETARNMNVILSNVVDNRRMNVEEMGIMRTTSNSQKLDEFIERQKQIAGLREIVGRAKPFRSMTKDSLHGLKSLTAHLLKDEDGSADMQLFDDPYNQRWLKSFST